MPGSHAQDAGHGVYANLMGRVFGEGGLEEVGREMFAVAPPSEGAAEEEDTGLDFDLNELFFEWNKYIIHINKQMDELLEKKKSIDEAAANKNEKSAQNNSQILSQSQI